MSFSLTDIGKMYKDSVSGHSKDIWILTIVSFVNRLGMIVLLFLSVYINTVLGFSLEKTSLLMSAFGIGSLTGTFIGGTLSDRLGEKIIIFFSLLLGGITLFLMQYPTDFWPLFVLMFIASMVGEAYRPALMSLVGKLVPKNKTARSMALIRLAVNLGFTGAGAMGGFVAAKFGYNWLFWIDGITCVLAAIFFATSLDNWKKIELSRSMDDQEKANIENIKNLHPLKNSNFLKLLFANLVIGLGFIQWFNAFPIFLKSEWLLDEWTIGLIMTVNGVLIVLLETPLIDNIEKYNKTHKAMAIGIVCMSISFVPFIFGNITFGIILALIGISFATLGEILLFPLITSTAIDMSHAGKRGQYMAYYSMSWSFVKIVAPYSLTLIAWTNYKLFFILLFVLTLMSLLFFYRIDREEFEKKKRD